MRSRIIIAVAAIVLTIFSAAHYARAHRTLPLGKELNSGWGNIYLVESGSDGIRPVTIVGFEKDGHRKNFIFCGKNEYYFMDHTVKHQMLFRWNPNKNCDQLVIINRTLMKGWDTVWFTMFEDE